MKRHSFCKRILMTNLMLRCFLGFAGIAEAQSKLGFSTYFGGSHEDFVQRIAVDPDGQTFVAGRTRSADFPTQDRFEFPGPFQRECSVGGGIFPLRFPCPDLTGFLAILDPRGRTVIRSTFFDYIADVATNRSGGVYIGGSAGTGDKRTGFVARLRSDGSIVWRTDVDSEVTSVAADTAGNVYGARKVEAGIVVFRLLPDGSAAVYQTVVAGPPDQSPVRVAVDRAESAHLLGRTAFGDAFVVRINSDGTLRDRTDVPRVDAADMAVSADGVVWVAGRARSQGYVGRIDPPGRGIAWSMTFPGSEARAIQLDQLGSAYVVGVTDSREFPATPDAVQRFPNGGTVETSDVYHNVFYSNAGDAFVAKIAADGALESATYLGGNNADFATAVAVLEPNRVVVAGNTRSPDWMVTPGVVREEYVKGNCYAARTGPNGPRDYQTYSWPCDDAFVTSVDLAPGTNAVAVVNSASRTSTPLAPGLLVSLVGTAATRVLFDGVPGTVLSAQPGQTNTVVPREVVGKESVRVEVEVEGRRIDVGTRRVAAVAPAVFTLSGTGVGGAAALNQDSTVNTAENPAPRGSVVVLYATGGGEMKFPVRVWIRRTVVQESLFTFRAGFVPMQLDYVGPAPGLVSGVIQINARVPEAAEVGMSVPVVLDIGGPGPLSATVAIN